MQSIQILNREENNSAAHIWEGVRTENYIHIQLKDYLEDTSVNSVYLKKECWFSISNWVNKSLEREGQLHEVGGLLLGGYRSDSIKEDHLELIVEAFAPIREVIAQSNTQLIVGPGFAYAYNDVLKADSDLLLIGWLHTHPGHGPFLSQTDLDQTQIFFKKPYQIAFVLDPMTMEYDTGIFSYQANGQMNNASNFSKWIPWKKLSAKKLPKE